VPKYVLYKLGSLPVVACNIGYNVIVFVPVGKDLYNFIFDICIFSFDTIVHPIGKLTINLYLCSMTCDCNIISLI
jgi:hypothetical protein